MTDIERALLLVALAARYKASLEAIRRLANQGGSATTIAFIADDALKGGKEK